MTDIIGRVFEVVLQTDEAYYHVAMFYNDEEAERIATQGNALIDADKWTRFEVKPYDTIANTGEWSVNDFVEALSPAYPESGDFFPIVDEDE